METQDPTSMVDITIEHVGLNSNFCSLWLLYPYLTFTIYPQTETWESNMDGNSVPTTMNIGDWTAISDLFDQECE